MFKLRPFTSKQEIKVKLDFEKDLVELEQMIILKQKSFKEPLKE